MSDSASKMRTRPLSARQAMNCEQAREPRCRCRCNGVLHGAKRVEDGDVVALGELEEDDPHYVGAEQMLLAVMTDVR